jgi:hypothetical protein
MTPVRQMPLQCSRRHRLGELILLDTEGETFLGFAPVGDEGSLLTPWERIRFMCPRCPSKRNVVVTHDRLLELYVDALQMEKRAVRLSD